MKRRLFLSGSAAGAFGLMGCGGGGGGPTGLPIDVATGVEGALHDQNRPTPADQAQGRQPFAGSAFPAKVMSCCYATWETGRFKIFDVPADFNVITLFGAKPDGAKVNGSLNNVGDGSFFFEHYSDVPAWHVQTCRSRGQRVLLTVGGAGQGFNFDTRAKSRNFVASYREIYDRLGGFDGCEFNNFEANIGSSPAEMIWIGEQLKGLYGPDFAITAPPQPNSAEDMALMKAMAAADVLTWCGPQYYDWSGFNAPGFIRQRTDEWVQAVGATKVVVGLTANYAHGPSMDDCIREWDSVEAAHPDIRGMYCWNAQLNLAGGNVWGSTMKARM